VAFFVVVRGSELLNKWKNRQKMQWDLKKITIFAQKYKDI
jgi:hypothetical protein